MYSREWGRAAPGPRAEPHLDKTIGEKVNTQRFADKQAQEYSHRHAPQGICRDSSERDACIGKGKERQDEVAYYRAEILFHELHRTYSLTRNLTHGVDYVDLVMAQDQRAT